MSVRLNIPSGRAAGIAYSISIYTGDLRLRPCILAAADDELMGRGVYAFACDMQLHHV